VRNKLLLALTLTTGLTSPAMAEQWFMVATAPEEISYADADSLVSQDNHRTLEVFTGNLNGVGPEGNIFYSTVKLEIDCGAHALRLLGGKDYDDNRQYLSASEFDAGWQAIPDDSVAQNFDAFACSGGFRANPVSDPFDDADIYFYYYYDDADPDSAKDATDEATDSTTSS